MTTEKSEWEWLRDGHPYKRAQLQMTRIENSATSGVPDVEGMFARGNHFWIELKVVTRPASLDSPVQVPHLRPKQVEWLHNRAALGARVWILLRVEGANRPTTHYLLHGKDAVAVKAGLTEIELARRRYNVNDMPTHILHAAGKYQFKSL